MRERLTKVRIEAATLAGGEVNQDYYAYGETYALVLDGASSFLPQQTSVDTVTYVESLGKSLAIRLESCHFDEISDAVAASIEENAHKYGLIEESSPNSTVAIAKWDQKDLFTYVLGDSSCLVIDNNGEASENTDYRMVSFGNDVRNIYKNRLQSGLGFDEEHRKLLQRLQIVQKDNRNIQGGYWIAGALFAAAYEGIVHRYCLDNIQSIFLMSDGGRECLEMLDESNASMFQSLNLMSLIEKRYIIEEKDNNATLLPRGKLHDDKTIIRINF